MKTSGVTLLGPAVLVVWLAGHFGLDMSAEVGTAIGGGLVIVGAAIWHRGLVGIARRLWRGEEPRIP